jgi:hypothetical protein
MRDRRRKLGERPVLSYLNRSFQLKEDGLRDEDFTSFGTEVPDLDLQQLHLLARTAAPHLEEAINY